MYHKVHDPERSFFMVKAIKMVYLTKMSFTNYNFKANNKLRIEMT